jgi:signal peptidase II
MKRIEKGKVLPFILTALIVCVDQGVKSYIAATWPRNGTLIKDLFNGFLQIYHVRNKAIAFSLGQNIPDAIKPVLFIILPILVLGFLLWYYLTSDEFAGIQRWAVAGIIGGGAGNIIDRIFRPDGVVDFVSVKFYGLLGLERWPTFNIADASVVVSCIILFLSIMIRPGRAENKAAS